MTASTPPSSAASEAPAVGTTSLNAYAAWLAKHETKAARKRSPAPVEVVASAEEEEGEGQIQQEIEDPYLQWLRRKETKLPLIKVVVASPDRVDEAPVGEGSNRGSEQANAVPTTKPAETLAAKESGLSKGKKRLATSDLTASPNLRAGKKAKRASIEVSPSPSSPQSPELDDSHPKGLAARAAVKVNANVKLPMLAEVRYWRDVDRFSFLS